LATLARGNSVIRVLWEQTYAIANQLDFAIKAQWVWQDTEGAYMPGVAGSFTMPA